MPCAPTSQCNRLRAVEGGHSCVIVNWSLFRQACNNVTVYHYKLVCFIQSVFKLENFIVGVTKWERVNVLFSCTVLLDTTSRRVCAALVGMWSECEVL